MLQFSQLYYSTEVGEKGMMGEERVFISAGLQPINNEKGKLFT